MGLEENVDIFLKQNSTAHILDVINDIVENVGKEDYFDAISNTMELFLILSGIDIVRELKYTDTEELLKEIQIRDEEDEQSAIE